MPELPEIETIKIGLQKRIIGLKITKIQILSAKTFIGNPNQVQGKKVFNIWRKAKYLGLDLEKISLLFHLKMTGQLIYDDGQRLVGGHPTHDMRDQMPNSHTRVIFSFSDGSHLYFNDQRRFGWIRVIKGDKGDMGNPSTHSTIAQGRTEWNRSTTSLRTSLGNLGPEPLEKGFSWEVLKENLLRHKYMPVKVALMDQTVVSGVGNIYSNEACFLAGIDPRTKVVTLTDDQFQALYRGVVRALRDGIKYGGATRAHFVDAEGHKGYFLDYAYVYGRNKHNCKVCKTDIEKINLGGRGTYFCPNCQKSL